MNKSKIGKQAIPFLKLQCENLNQEITGARPLEPSNNVVVKPLRSAKNIHELKTFDFDPQKVEIINNERELRKFRKLELERERLRQSLVILKESAVFAIAEKVDEIERLRAKDSLTNDEKIEFFEKELEKNQKIKYDLEEEKEELRRQFDEERSKYVEVVLENENYIESLHEEIKEKQEQLEYLQKMQQLKIKKIKLLEEENQKLNMELTQIKFTSFSSDYGRATDQQKVISSPSLTGSLCLSMNDSIQNFMLSESGKTIMNEKLQQITKVHKNEMTQMKCHYEKCILDLREKYQRSLYQKTYEHQKELVSRKKSMEKRSSFSLVEQHFSQKDSGQIEYYQVESISNPRIIKNDLKNELRLQNMSQNTMMERRFLTEGDEGDNESQFTMKYFENPFQFHKKESNIHEIEVISNYEARTTLRIKRNGDQKCENMLTQKNDLPQSQSKPKQPSGNNSNRNTIFLGGLFSGVAVAYITGFILKKFQ